MLKQLRKLGFLCLCLLLLVGYGRAQAAQEGEAVDFNSPEGGAATNFLFSLPKELTGLFKDKNYTYRIEYTHFLESKAPCYNVLCIGADQADNQWLVVAEDNSRIYRNPGNGTVGESAMELLFPNNRLKKLKTQEDALNHLREYLLESNNEKKSFALRLDPNSRADGPGTWSIEIALGENHPDHFVTLEHYRVFNNGVIEKMAILDGEYKRVNYA
jgi:hypothetical protein